MLLMTLSMGLWTMTFSYRSSSNATLDHWVPDHDCFQSLLYRNATLDLEHGSPDLSYPPSPHPNATLDLNLKHRAPDHYFFTHTLNRNATLDREPGAPDHDFSHPS